jgi:hypothetical protein
MHHSVLKNKGPLVFPEGLFMFLTLTPSAARHSMVILFGQV